MVILCMELVLGWFVWLVSLFDLVWKVSFFFGPFLGHMHHGEHHL